MTSSLSGVRIWLSGSFAGKFPVDGVDADYERFSRLIRRLAQTAFQDGGAIIHGSHPSITDILLDAASEYQVAKGQKAPLTLAVSDYFLKDPVKYRIDRNKWERLSRVVSVPEAVADVGQDNSLAKSLELLRDRIAAECDVVIGLGGRWWEIAGEAAGVPA